MLEHWIWLAARPGMNDREKRDVLAYFGDPEEAYFAKDLSGLETVSKPQALLDKDLTGAGEVLCGCEKRGIRILTLNDPAYPARLKQIADPPLVLYYKGTLPDLEAGPAIGVVGTRKASLYGIRIAQRMGYQISRCGGIVVTGMASGVDTAAARGALAAGAAAVGILGCGVDVVYPASSRALFAQMAQDGCLMSEFPPGTPPYKWNFPKRNRIISGMANGVLVVEAPETSGALITARLALEQGRDVFAVPGNIDMDTCAGSNALLGSGAAAVRSGWDVVREYQRLYPDTIHMDISRPPEAPDGQLKVAQIPLLPKKKEDFRQENDKKAIDKISCPPYSDQNEPSPVLTEMEGRVAALLDRDGRLVDDIIVQSGLPSGAALAALTTLQVKGIAVALPGRRVARKQ